MSRRSLMVIKEASAAHSGSMASQCQSSDSKTWRSSGLSSASQIANSTKCRSASCCLAYLLSPLPEHLIVGHEVELFPGRDHFDPARSLGYPDRTMRTSGVV